MIPKSKLLWSTFALILLAGCSQEERERDRQTIQVQEKHIEQKTKEIKLLQNKLLKEGLLPNNTDSIIQELPILVMCAEISDLTNLSGISSLGLTLGIKIEAKSYSTRHLDPEKYRAAIICIGPTHEETSAGAIWDGDIGNIYNFCKRGRRAIVFTFGNVARSNSAMQNAFGISIVNKGPGIYNQISGKNLCWLLDGLTIGLPAGFKSKAGIWGHYVTDGNEVKYTEHQPGKKLSVQINVGRGDALFIMSNGTYNGGWYHPYGVIFNDETFGLWDNSEALSRLIEFAASYSTNKFRPIPESL